jgi:hypothetical protein
MAFDTGQLVQFTYSAPNPGIVGGSTVTTTGVLGASGAMTITGTQFQNQVPEPASIALFCTVLGIGLLRRNSKKRAE